MRRRYLRGGVIPCFVVCLLAVFLVSCSNPSVTSLTISPTSETLGVGNSAQFTAMATLSQGTHPKSTEDVTDTATWSSSNTGVATVSSTGMVTAVAPGTASVTAKMAGFPGTISASATLTVSGSSSGSSGGGGTSNLVSLALIPNSQFVAALGETAQFIAIGTYAGNPGTTVDLTDQANWSSSDSAIATVTATGLVASVSQGTATITAIANNPAGGIVTGSATFTVTSASHALQSISVIPSSQTVTALGESSQFVAIGSFGGSPAETVNLTNSTQVVWSSSDTSVATVNNSGLVTAVGGGSTTITVIDTDPATGNVVAGTANFTVSVPAVPEPLLSLTILPSSQPVGSVGETGQFIAIGTFSSAPTTRDVTKQVAWSSSDVKVATINSSGLATALNQGSTAILAIYTEPDGSLVTSAASFTAGFPNGAGTPQATLTIVPMGANGASGDITSSDSTGSLQVIHCGPGLTGGSVCVGTFPLGTTVTLTASPEAGSSAEFYGWSANCVPTTHTNVCTLTLNNNQTVASIFN